MATVETVELCPTQETVAVATAETVETAELFAAQETVAEAVATAAERVETVGLLVVLSSP